MLKFVNKKCQIWFLFWFLENFWNWKTNLKTQKWGAKSAAPTKIGQLTSNKIIYFLRSNQPRVKDEIIFVLDDEGRQSHVADARFSNSFSKSKITENDYETSDLKRCAFFSKILQKLEALSILVVDAIVIITPILN